MMVVSSLICCLFYGFSIASINILFDKGVTGKINNTGSGDILVFLKEGMHRLALAGQQVTVGKALG